jgi:RND superfamily putative drug exporter
MHALMLRLDAVVRRHRRPIIALWVVVLLVAVPFSLRQSEDLSSGGFGVPGSQAQVVQDALDRGDFPGVPQAELAAVLVREPGATDAQLAAAQERLRAAAVKVEHVAPGGGEPQTKGGTTVIPLKVDVPEDDATDVAADLRKELAIADGARDGVHTHLIGQGALWAGMQDLSKEDLAKAEFAGFPIVLLILLAVFGSLVAASLPLIMGVFSVLVTGALIWAVSQVMDMSVFVTNMASMIGIGVAVDYSLFVLARYREEIASGHEPDEARARAMATSGIAVLFSGMTVIVSLAGLYMIDNTAIRSMALGAILVVAVSLLASATLLPALIRAFGHRAYTPGRFVGRLQRDRVSPSGRTPAREPGPQGQRSPFWERWTAAVTRRPVLAVVGSSAVLLTLAIPTLSLDVSAGALRQFPAGHETRAGFEAAAAVTGPGAASAVKVLAPAADAQEVQRRLEDDPRVATVLPPQVSRDGDSVIVQATTKADAESDAAKNLVYDLRDALPQASVGGVPASQEDLSVLVLGSMWKVLLFVLGLSFIVLTVLLRSIVLPIKAVLMNLLSVGAAYGVLVAVFQYGWIDGFLGFQSTGYLDTLVPPLVLAVVFGLSMDYEVFLLSRIRERYEAVGDTRLAVAEGLAGSARTITSAALIMVAVFAVFVGTGVPSIKAIGVGCAVAIAVDATLVRLILVPAAMELLGRWNWWLPKPLARVLPKSSFEELPARVAV